MTVCCDPDVSINNKVIDFILPLTNAKKHGGKKHTQNNFNINSALLLHLIST